MSYAVKLHPAVIKFLDKLDKHLAERTKKRLKLLKENPYRYLEHFEGQDFYKFRIGDYRALIDVDKSRKIVFVRVLDHRGRIYKKK